LLQFTGLPTLAARVVTLDVDLRRVDTRNSVVIGNWQAAPSADPVPYLSLERFHGTPLSQFNGGATGIIELLSMFALVCEGSDPCR
jgi:hypothetical protein